MTASTCRICGQPVHRYSPDHPGTPDDLMGCDALNTPLGGWHVIDYTEIAALTGEKTP